MFQNGQNGSLLCLKVGLKASKHIQKPIQQVKHMQTHRWIPMDFWFCLQLSFWAASWAEPNSSGSRATSNGSTKQAEPRVLKKSKPV